MKAFIVSMTIILFFVSIVFAAPYKNKSGSSGITDYWLGRDYITVKFASSPRRYKYSYKSAGKENVKTMQKLAKAGRGLNSYINRHAKSLYER
ncbi:MAG: hypothetical protein LBU09_02245 [Endomicrobium sp.]|jgi:hypothetical protein|nr:hypothetical protein [Endomicrobium sp.]